MTKWVAVTESVPDEGVQVLGLFENNGMAVTYREQIKRTVYWMDTTGAAIGDPSHWMPLPEPPTVGAERE